MALNLDVDWTVATVKQLADFYLVERHKVIAWIKSGELAAANVATDPDARPTWRIARADFDRFWESRSSARKYEAVS